MLTGQMDKSYKDADCLTLHTVIAQKLFDGEWKSRRIGLIQFASLTNYIYESYTQDDPYAAWILLKIHSALLDAIKRSNEINIQLKNYCANLRGIVLGSLEVKPIWRKPIIFTTIFPRLAACLLGNIDYAIKKIETLYRYGAAPQEGLIDRKSVRRLVQNVFSMPLKWRRTNVTRNDVRENTQAAIQARENLSELINELGDVQLEILDKEFFLPFLPKFKGQLNEKSK